MTNTIALWIAGLILALAVGDALLYDSDNAVFLGRKFLALVEWLAFWR